MSKAEEFLKLAQNCGFTGTAELNTASLICMPEVRDMCSADRCNRYGKSWSCPPACGSVDDCNARIKEYDKGILVQTTVKLEDDFDAEAMIEGQKVHKEHFYHLIRDMRMCATDILPLSAGSCTLCEKCSYPDEACRRPDEMFSSMEAFGLLVSDVCEKSGIPYYYGPLTLTYTSCVLYKGE